MSGRMNGKNFRNVIPLYRVAVYSTFPGDLSMIRIVGTILAGLLGLAFGSFLNVCLSRWPEGESVVKPRSHCRNCGRTLAWWENVPLVSWIALRGRCRTCKAKISWRYPLVELAVGGACGLSIHGNTFFAVQHLTWAAWALSLAHRLFYRSVFR